MENYSYTTVPTKLMLVMENRLQSILFNLIQLSSAFAGEDGYFYRSNSDLQKAFGCSKYFVIAAIETLYRHGIISVKSNGFVKGRRRTNYYRVNFENFKNWDNLSLMELYNLPDEKRIKILNYSSKDFKVTYTNTEKASQEPQKDVTLTTIHKGRKNATATKGTALNEVFATVVEPRTYITPTEKREKIRKNAEILINRLRQCKEWEDYKDKMKKYEQWLNKCFSTLDDDDLKRHLLKKAQHVMDEITFSNDIPKPIEYTDFPTVRKVEKVYIYLGDEAKDEEMTVSQCTERGYNVRLLFDTDKHIFFCPS